MNSDLLLTIGAGAIGYALYVQWKKSQVKNVVVEAVTAPTVTMPASEPIVDADVAEPAPGPSAGFYDNVVDQGKNPGVAIGAPNSTGFNPQILPQDSRSKGAAPRRGPIRPAGFAHYEAPDVSVFNGKSMFGTSKLQEPIATTRNMGGLLAQ